jgi:hypothetical protein
VLTVELVGGRWHGHSEQLRQASVPQTVAMVDCPHCRREHVVPTDHWISWKGFVEFYWLQKYDARDRLAVYVLPNLDTELAALTSTSGLDLRELCCRYHAAYG